LYFIAFAFSTLAESKSKILSWKKKANVENKEIQFKMKENTLEMAIQQLIWNKFPDRSINPGGFEEPFNCQPTASASNEDEN
jgi:hypothetical protein